MVTVGRAAYNLMYRFGAPWEGADRVELRRLVEDGRCSPEALAPPGRKARAVDLGCGAGAVAIELAEAGFDVVGIDFSRVALQKARAAAAAAGLDGARLRFVEGDLTAGEVAGVDGPFDLLVDYGTLDDLPGDGRRAMARYTASLARPGARFFLYAFGGDPRALPRFSFSGPSRSFPGLVPGEVEALFGPTFRIEVLEAPTPSRHIGTWLLERLGEPVDVTSSLSTSPPAPPRSSTAGRPSDRHPPGPAVRRGPPSALW